MVKLAREQVQKNILTELWTILVCVENATSIVTRGLCVLEACDVKIELVPWSEQQQ